MQTRLVKHQPDTSQSAGSALAATIRWASGVVEGSPCQPNEKVESQPEVESVSQSECPGATIKWWTSGVVNKVKSQSETESSVSH